MAQTDIAQLGVNIRMAGAREAEAALTRVGASARAAGSGVSASLTKGAGAARGFGMALEGMARSGSNSLASVVNAGAGVAMLFSPAGAILGSLALFGLAFARHMQKTRDEMRSVRVAFEQELIAMRRAGDEASLQNTVTQLERIRLGVRDAPGSARETEEVRDFAKAAGIEASQALVFFRQGLLMTIADSERLTEDQQERVRLLAEGSVSSERARELHKQIEETAERLTVVNRARNELQARENDLVGTEVNLRRQLADEHARSVDSARHLAALERGRTPTIGARPQVRDAVGSDDPMRSLLQYGGRTLMLPGGNEVNPFGRRGTIVLDNAIRVKVPVAPEVEIVQSFETLGILDQMTTMAEQVGAILEFTLEDAVSSAFVKAFTSRRIGDGIQALSDTVLSGLGSIAIQLGTQTIVFGQWLTALSNALSNLSGIGAIAAGVGLIAFGASLQGLVAGRTANDSRGVSSGRSLSESTRTVLSPSVQGANASSIAPTPSINIWSIGEDDLAAQRRLANMVEKASARGIGRRS